MVRQLGTSCRAPPPSVGNETWKRTRVGGSVRPGHTEPRGGAAAATPEPPVWARTRQDQGFAPAEDAEGLGGHRVPNAALEPACVTQMTHFQSTGTRDVRAHSETSSSVALCPPAPGAAGRHSPGLGPGCLETTLSFSLWKALSPDPTYRDLVGEGLSSHTADCLLSRLPRREPSVTISLSYGPRPRPGV